MPEHGRALGGPALIFEAQPGRETGPAFNDTFWFGPQVKLGASLTQVTLMVKVHGCDMF